MNALASLAISKTSKNNTIAPIATHVMAMVFAGVRNLLWTWLINSGNRPSLDIAKGNLEEAKTPAFTVETRVKTAIIAIATPKIFIPFIS